MPNMPFPAVTICNANPFRADRINETLLAYVQRHGINLTENNRWSLVTSMLVNLFNRNESDQYLNIGFQLSDTLIECSYNHINCSSYFVRSFSLAFHYCYTFNWKITTKKLFTLADVGSGISPFEGLSMTFYVPRHLNFPMAEYPDGNPALVAAWCFRCPPQCTHTHFSTEISSLAAPTPAEKAMLAEVLLNNTLNLALPTDFHENFDEYMNANYLRMTITCASEYVTIKRQEPKLSIVDTFSAIGGQTGL
ncbi:unnamed protein product [Rotaria sordida]|nr:unnamed protein product [Rotaria sordida]CAF3724174.1 unnamed protein product [Rotaria sordida]CAF3996123.1 unnamed protein product [Rotaria sordida]